MITDGALGVAERRASLIHWLSSLNQPEKREAEFSKEFSMDGATTFAHTIIDDMIRDRID